MDAIPQVFNPPREPIDEVMPALFIKIVGTQLLIRFLAREHMKGTDDHRVCDGHNSPFLPPAGRQAVVQGREIGPSGPRRGVGQLGEDRPEGLVSRSGRTRHGNQPLRTVLTQLAHAAAHTKGTYLSALYHRLAARRGRKRAIVAVAHSMVVNAFYMFVRQEPYHELGATYFDEQRRHHVVDRLMRRIEQLGYHVHLEPRPTTAS